MITELLHLLQIFRKKLLSVFLRRADALFGLSDALLLTLDPRSPVELSVSPAFRRRFSMVYTHCVTGRSIPIWPVKSSPWQSWLMRSRWQAMPSA